MHIHVDKNRFYRNTMKRHQFTHKFLFLFLGIWLVSQPVLSAPITRQQAQRNAHAFLQKKGINVKLASMRHTPLKNSVKENAPYYVFNIGDNKGFVIASGDDKARTVLGYSKEGSFDAENMPDGLKYLLDTYEEQIRLSAVQTESEETETTVTYPAVEPMLTTKWHQRNPYNTNCPRINGRGTYSGCVATAMAQVLYYHHNQLSNTVMKRIPGYWIDDVFVNSIPKGAEIDWDNMLDEYIGQYYTDEQAQAVANLLLYCGTAVGTKYGSNSSSAHNSGICDALTNYFGYQESKGVYRNQYSDEEWLKMVCEELSKGNPIIYAGTSTSGIGHCFVVDGYDGNGYIHANWGDGNYGYCLLSATDNGDSSNVSTIGGYSNDQYAVFSVEPTENPVPNLKTTNITLNSDTLIKSSSGFVDPELGPQGSYKVSFDCVVENITGISDGLAVGSLVYNCESNGDETLCSQDQDSYLDLGIQGPFSYTGDDSFQDLNGYSIYKYRPGSVVYSIENIDADLIPNANEDLYVSVVIKDGKSKVFVGKPDVGGEIVHFKDEEVKRICLDKFWDINEDGELSTNELAYVKDLGSAFDYERHIVSFDELRYFTNISTVNFRDATRLKAITIPENVKSFGYAAFENNTSLTSVKVNWSEPITIKDAAFPGTVYENATLYVPQGTLAAYQAATGWKNFTNIVEWVWGDVNRDGVVDVSDVTLTIDHVLGASPAKFDASVADLNKDDVIDINDITRMIQTILVTSY